MPRENLSEILHDIKFSDNWESIDECISEIKSNSKFMDEIFMFKFRENTVDLMKSLSYCIECTKSKKNRVNDQKLKKELENYSKKLKSIRKYLSEQELKKSKETDGDKMFNMMIEVLQPYVKYVFNPGKYLFADKDKIKSVMDKMKERFTLAKNYFDKAVRLWGENSKIELFEDFGNKLKKIADAKDELELVECIKNCDTQTKSMSKKFVNSKNRRNAFCRSLGNLNSIFKDLSNFVDALAKQRTIKQKGMKDLKDLYKKLEKITFVGNDVKVEDIKVEDGVKDKEQEKMAMARVIAYNKIDKRAAAILKELKNELETSVWDEINIEEIADKLIEYLDNKSVTYDGLFRYDPIPIPRRKGFSKDNYLYMYFCEVIEKWNNKRTSVVYNHFKVE